MTVKSIGFKIKQYAPLSLLLVIVLLIHACGDDKPDATTTPIIFLEKTQIIKDGAGRDSLLIVGIGYEDSDGDIGLEATDTFPPFNRGSAFQYNLLLDIKEIKNNKQQIVFQPGTSEPENFNQRVPNITPTGKNKHISGSIDVRLDASKNYLYPDSIIITIQLLDRALNKSNVLNTKTIKLTH